MATNIWQLQAQGNVSAIIEALDTPEQDIRRRAISALRMLDAKEAILKLRSLRENEFNPQTLELIESTLEHLTRDTPKEEDELEKHKRQLLEQLQSNDPEKVYQAASALGEFKNDRTVIEPLVFLFRNPLQPVKLRLAAAEALLKLKSALTSISLLGALRKPDWQVRRNAAAVLGQLQADWSADPLKEVMLNDPHPIVRKTAEAALQRIQTPEALAALQEKAASEPETTAPPIST